MWSRRSPCKGDGRRDMAAFFSTWGKKLATVYVGIDIRVPHQLPGKPAPGAGSKHVGSYSLCPKIKRKQHGIKVEHGMYGEQEGSHLEWPDHTGRNRVNARKQNDLQFSDSNFFF